MFAAADLHAVAPDEDMPVEYLAWIRRAAQARRVSHVDTLDAEAFVRDECEQTHQCRT